MDQWPHKYGGRAKPFEKNESHWPPRCMEEDFITIDELIQDKHWVFSILDEYYHIKMSSVPSMKIKKYKKQSLFLKLLVILN